MSQSEIRSMIIKNTEWNFFLKSECVTSGKSWVDARVQKLIGAIFFWKSNFVTFFGIAKSYSLRRKEFESKLGSKFGPTIGAKRFVFWSYIFQVFLTAWSVLLIAVENPRTMFYLAIRLQTTNQRKKCHNHSSSGISF